MALRCHSCGDEIEAQPIRKGERYYCREAWAFEGVGGKGCDDRSDSTAVQPIVELV